MSFNTVNGRSVTKAKALGIEMAHTDAIIAPRLKDAGRYDDYIHFRTAHRTYWEQSDRYTTFWQQRIFRLCEREAECGGLPDCANVFNLALWHNRLLNPLKDAMWESWEDACELARLYEQARANLRVDQPLQPGQPLRIASAGADEVSHRQPMTIAAVAMSNGNSSEAAGKSEGYGYLRLSDPSESR